MSSRQVQKSLPELFQGSLKPMRNRTTHTNNIATEI